MANILVTDFGDDCENVMIFTDNPKYTVETVEEMLSKKGATFNEIYEVPEKDLGYYLYEPLHLK